MQLVMLSTQHTHTHISIHTYTYLSLQNGEIPHLFGECKADEAYYWVPVLLAYKGILLLIGLFLAIETYDVK